MNFVSPSNPDVRLRIFGFSVHNQTNIFVRALSIFGKTRRFSKLDLYPLRIFEASEGRGVFVPARRGPISIRAMGVRSRFRRLRIFELFGSLANCGTSAGGHLVF